MGIKKRNNRRFLFGAMCVVSLVGCDKLPLSTGASNSAEQPIENHQRLSKAKELEQSKHRQATSETPLLVLMIESVLSVSDAMAQNFNEVLFSSICSFGTNKTTQDIMDAARAETLKGVPGTATYDDPGSIFNYGSQQQNLALCVSYIMRQFIKPAVGWPHDIVDDDQALRDHMRGSTAVIIASTEVFSRMVPTLLAEPVKTKDEYLDRIQALLEVHSVAFFPAYDQEIETPHAFSPDFTGQGPAPIHFIREDGYDYQQGPMGPYLAYQGIDWFGKGYLKGTLHRITVAQEQTATLVREQALQNEKALKQQQGVNNQMSTQ